MRGFLSRTSVEEATALVDQRVRWLEAEWISLLEAGGRALAHDVTALADVPAFARSAMDGFAVMAEETFSACADDPRPLTIVGESRPGRACETPVAPGQCVRIMTGAPLPAGADAVVPVEQTRREGDVCCVTAPFAPGQHVSARGEDIAKGAVVLRAGRRLRAQDLGVLSSLGRARISVIRRPAVALVITGDEVVPAGARVTGYQIPDAVTPLVRTLIERDGGRILTGPIVRDQEELVREAIQVSVNAADIVLVAGGSSVGQHDLAPGIVRALGELSIHGIAMRPSSPAGIGFIQDKPVFLLPGNPLSAMCAYEFFAGRAVRCMAGRHNDWPHTKMRMPLGQKISSMLGRTDYVRVRIEDERVWPIAISGASILTSATRAHGFAIVPAEAEGYPEGATITVRLY